MHNKPPVSVVVSPLLHPRWKHSFQGKSCFLIELTHSETIVGEEGPQKLLCVVVTGERNQELDINIFMLHKPVFQRVLRTDLILACKTFTTNSSLRHEYSYCKIYTSIKQRVYSLLGFLLPLDSSAFQRMTEKNPTFPHDWEQHKGHLCQNLQRDSISPLTLGGHFPPSELWPDTESTTFGVYSKPVGTKCKYFATNLFCYWRGKILWVEERV